MGRLETERSGASRRYIRLSLVRQYRRSLDRFNGAPAPGRRGRSRAVQSGSRDG